jgi:hypothetical protein
MAKHMKAFEQGPLDNDKGVKEGSKADLKRDAREKKHMKALPHKKGMSEADMGDMSHYGKSIGVHSTGSTMLRAGPNYRFGGKASPVTGSPGANAGIKQAGLYGSGTDVSPNRTTAGNNANQTTPMNRAGLGTNFAIKGKRMGSKKA